MIDDYGVDKYGTDCHECDALMALTVGDEEGARETLAKMSEDELRALMRICAHLEWLARATINLRNLFPQQYSR